MEKLKSMGWQTNEVKFGEKEGKKVVIKTFNSVKPILLFTLYNLGYFLNSKKKFNLNENDYSFPPVKERIENEIKARKILKDLGFKVPEIYWYDEKSICMEALEGENLPEFYKKKEINFVKEVSKRIGKQMRKVHEHGFAFLDCRSENYIVKDNEIYHLDLEFFTKISEFKKMCDIITYNVSILNLNPKKCKAVIESFYDGYGKKMESNELVNMFLFSLIYPFSLKENLNELLNRGLNLYILTRENSKFFKRTTLKVKNLY